MCWYHIVITVTFKLVSFFTFIMLYDKVDWHMSRLPGWLGSSNWCCCRGIHTRFLTCRMRWSARPNVFWQTLQLNRRLSKWTTAWCSFSLYRLWKLLLHNRQVGRLFAQRFSAWALVVSALSASTNDWLWLVLQADTSETESSLCALSVLQASPAESELLLILSEKSSHKLCKIKKDNIQFIDAPIQKHKQFCNLITLCDKKVSAPLHF